MGEHEPFEFPEKQELQLRLKDVLQDEVEEKFYLDNEKTQKFLAQLDYKPTKEIKLHQIGNFEKLANPNKKFNDPQVGRVLDKEGICQALDTMQGGNRQPKILIKNATKQGYLEATVGDGIDLAYPDSKTRRGRVQKGMSQTLQTSDTIGTIEFPVICASRGRNPENPSDRTLGTHLEQRIEVNKNKTSNTLTTVQKDNYVLDNGPRIRKLTPLECWRLMGFSDTDFYKAQAVNSNTQLYKQAGNSIVVDVLEAIFDKMFNTEKEKI